MMGRFATTAMLAVVASFTWVTTALGDQTFQFGGAFGTTYSPSHIDTVTSGEKITWSTTSDFNTHPLRFDTGDLPDHTAADSSYSQNATLRPGFYAFHCAVHGAQGEEGSVGAGMAGYFVIPGDQQATPDFTFGPASPETGQTVTFSYSGTADPDAATGDAIARYYWDLDGNGSFETVVSAPTSTASHAYATAGTYMVTVEVIDKGHELSAAVTHAVTVTAPGGAGGGGTGGGAGGGGAGADVLAPAVTVSVPRSSSFRGLLAHSVTARVTTSEPSTARATLRAGKRVLGRGSVSFSVAGTKKLKLTLSRAGRSAVRRAARRTRRLSLRLTFVVTDLAGNASTVVKTMRLHR